ncbi:MAG: hypothetical protein HYZ16_10420 [Bacteroidetes bacterium]|jgi:hypothetical protein|nr:hypothetical protein [Bacteroidota bacterium]
MFSRKSANALGALLLGAFTCLAPAIPSGRALTIYPSPNGAYVVFEHGLSTYDGHQWQIVLPTPTDKVTSLHINQHLACAGTFNGYLHFIGDSGIQTVELPVQANGTPHTVNGIAFAKGKWWASTLEGSVFRVSPTGSFEQHVLRAPKSDMAKNIVGLAKDNNGYLWVPSLDGMYFLTDIHKSKQKKLGFLASEAYSNPIDRLAESPQGIYVLSHMGGNKPKLYLSTLSTTLMDALKKEIALPEEFNNSQVDDMVFALGQLWIRSSNSLYKLSNYNWEKVRLDASSPIDNCGFSPGPTQVWTISKGKLQALPYR